MISKMECYTTFTEDSFFHTKVSRVKQGDSIDIRNG